MTRTIADKGPQLCPLDGTKLVLVDRVWYDAPIKALVCRKCDYERLLKLCWSIEGLKDAAEICHQSLPAKAERRRA